MLARIRRVGRRKNSTDGHGGRARRALCFVGEFPTVMEASPSSVLAL
jgi:hypothetical protein